MDDIVERLKSQNELYVQKYVGTYDIDETKVEPLCEEAAAEITRLREQNVRLWEALRPFSDELKEQQAEVPHVTEDESLIHSYTLRLKHLRAAAAAIREGGE